MGPGIANLHWIGRFGNRMHQIAYGATYALKNNTTFYLPSAWEGTTIFEQPFPLLPEDLRTELASIYGAPVVWNSGPANDGTRPAIAGPKAFANYVAQISGLKYDAKVHCATCLPYKYEEGSVTAFDNLCAYNRAIFGGMSISHLKQVFRFNERVRSLDLYKRLEDSQGTYTIAHLRRDDIADAPRNKQNPRRTGASVLSIQSYQNAFKAYGVDPQKVQWISDDYTSKWLATLGIKNLEQRGGWKYPEGSVLCNDQILFTWLPDFLRLYFAGTIFRANSSFSFWPALLSNTAKVYAPRLTKRVLYDEDNPSRELDVAFEEGNHPHWLAIKSEGCPDIAIGP